LKVSEVHQQENIEAIEKQFCSREHNQRGYAFMFWSKVHLAISITKSAVLALGRHLNGGKG
jgi:hypothetical protein